MAPDEQLASVVFAKAPETCPSTVPDFAEEDQHPGGEEHSGEAGGKGRRFVASPLPREKANQSRRFRLSDFNSKSSFFL